MPTIKKKTYREFQDAAVQSANAQESGGPCGFVFQTRPTLPVSGTLSTSPSVGPATCLRLRVAV